ncbi:MAG: ABC transporter permease [Anaerolineae bacterium]
MIRYVLRRLLWLVVVVLGMTLLTFVVTHLIPADPAKAAAGLDATADQIERAKQDLGLYRPLPEQYLIYLRNLATGDLGTSIVTKRPVRDDLRDYLPATIELALAAFVVVIVLGIPLGITAASHRGGIVDTITRILATVWVAMPVFVFALLLQLIFYVKLGWLPAGERLDAGIKLDPITGMVTVDSILRGNVAAFLSGLRHLILPVLALALARLAIVSRMTRSSILDLGGADFIRTARAKGLAERTILYRHTLKNASMPILTTLGTQLAFLLGGSILVEAIFQWPGMGRYAVSSITSVDFPAIMGVTVVMAIIFMLVNLAVDIAYLFIDPRVQY